MKSVKRFLIGFIAVYVVIGLAVNMLFGPPGFSNAFLAQYGDDVERYLDIVKSEPYKLWDENPSVNPPGPELERDIAFVNAFRSNPDFREEMDRRTLYNAVSDWFNVIMLTVLVVVLARGPVATFVRGLVKSERERIETIERERSAAVRRKADAERKLEQLQDERQKAEQYARDRIDEETAKIDRATADAIGRVRQETEDRRRHEALLARHRLKAIIADEAIDLIEQRYRKKQSREHTEVLIEQFLQELGERA